MTENLLAGLVAAVLLGGAAWFSLHLASRRARALRALAGSLGFDFAPEGDDEAAVEIRVDAKGKAESKTGKQAGPIRLGEIDGLAMFDPAFWAGRRLLNLATGRREDFEVALFDYEATARCDDAASDGPTNRVRITAVRVRGSGVFPSVTVRRKDWRSGMRVALAFSGQEGRLPEELLDPALAGAFEICSPEPELAVALLRRPALVSALLGAEVPSVEIRPREVLLHSTLLVLPAERMKGLLDRGMAIFRAAS